MINEKINHYIQKVIKINSDPTRLSKCILLFDSYATRSKNVLFFGIRVVFMLRNFVCMPCRKADWPKEIGLRFLGNFYHCAEGKKRSIQA